MGSSYTQMSVLMNHDGIASIGHSILAKAFFFWIIVFRQVTFRFAHNLLVPVGANCATSPILLCECKTVYQYLEGMFSLGIIHRTEANSTWL